MHRQRMQFYEHIFLLGLTVDLLKHELEMKCNLVSLNNKRCPM